MKHPVFLNVLLTTQRNLLDWIFIGCSSWHCQELLVWWGKSLADEKISQLIIFWCYTAFTEIKIFWLVFQKAKCFIQSCISHTFPNVIMYSQWLRGTANTELQCSSIYEWHQLVQNENTSYISAVSAVLQNFQPPHVCTHIHTAHRDPSQAPYSSILWHITVASVLFLTLHCKPMAISVVVHLNASEKQTESHISRGQRRRIPFGFLPCVCTSHCSTEALAFFCRKIAAKMSLASHSGTVFVNTGGGVICLFAFLTRAATVSCTDSLASKVN